MPGAYIIGVLFNMRTKIVIAALISAISINVASADNHDAGLNLGGTIGAGYVSEKYFRGQSSGGESLQANVSFNTSVESVGVYVDLTTTQSVDSTEIDTNDITAGLSLGLGDKIDLLLGVYNTDISTSGGTLEGFVGVQLSSLLNPSVTVYRNTNQELYTYEGGVCHTVELGVFDLVLCGWLGSTELTTSVDSTYYGGRVAAVKSVGDIDFYANVAVDDNEDRDTETLWGAGIAVKF